ncbi:unnamed protein product [Toxocara canis]|uniref:Transposase n=1 Tax=Toxocara canis TaxID=6265 RepID=A0A183UCC4_TOXCA|nr:unnamed protein product [Toxocara canis]
MSGAARQWSVRSVPCQVHKATLTSLIGANSFCQLTNRFSTKVTNSVEHLLLAMVPLFDGVAQKRLLLRLG